MGIEQNLRRAARAGGAGGKITAALNRLDMVYDATFRAMVADLVSALERLEAFVDGGSANAEAGQIQQFTAGSVKG